MFPSYRFSFRFPPKRHVYISVVVYQPPLKTAHRRESRRALTACRPPPRAKAVFIHIICSRYGAGLGRLKTLARRVSHSVHVCVTASDNVVIPGTPNESACFRPAPVVVPVVDPANSSPATGVHVAEMINMHDNMCTVRVSSTDRLPTGRGHVFKKGPISTRNMGVVSGLAEENK